MNRVRFAPGEFYHLYNRGTEKRKIFLSKRDYERFLALLYLGNSKKAVHLDDLFKSPRGFTLRKVLEIRERGETLVELAAYCLMQNHFHLLLKQGTDDGIMKYIRHLINSYVHYVNVKYKRIGPLFQGRFKNVLVESDEQLLHLSRYIHLNPFVSGLVTDLALYPWSSYNEHLGVSSGGICNPQLVLDHFSSPEAYKDFVNDHAEYARSIDAIKHLTIDEE